jgi:glucose/mannose-6-phosphate isomerase
MKESNSMDSINFVGMTLGLPEQFETALAQALEVDVAPLAGIEFSSVIVLGLGGSGVSGDIVSAVLAPECKVPVIVSKHYELPAFVDSSTLVIAVSYSGTTEETLTAVKTAQTKNAPMVVVCSGGDLANLAEKSSSPVIRYSAPSSLQPRAGMGALISPIMVALDKLGIYEHGIRDIQSAIKATKLRRDECKDINAKNTATELAKKIGPTIPLIYGGGALGAVAAYRFKCDVNENAKTQAFWHYYPELNHNELVGFGQNGDVTRQLITLVELRHDFEHKQVQRRFEISRELIRETLHDIVEVKAYGDTAFAQLVDLAYVGSLTSVYMAIEAGVDPGPVDIIWELKNALS